MMVDGWCTEWLVLDQQASGESERGSMRYMSSSVSDWWWRNVLPTFVHRGPMWAHPRREGDQVCWQVQLQWSTFSELRGRD